MDKFIEEHNKRVELLNKHIDRTHGKSAFSLKVARFANEIADE